MASQPLQGGEDAREISEATARAIEVVATLAEETETRVVKWSGRPSKLRMTRMMPPRKWILEMISKNQIKSPKMMMNRLMQM